MEVPDYVKESSVHTDDVASLTPAQFGLPHRREFPLDTPGHVFLSYGYCKSAGIKTSELMEKILKAGAFFSIEADLTKIDAAFDNLTKKASEEKPYALYIDFGTAQPDAENPGIKVGGVRGFYPISSGYEVEQSALKLANERAKIPIELFAEGCRNLVKAATEHKVELRLLPRQIADYGIERIPNPEYLEKAAADRKAATGDELYEDLALTANENPEGMPAHAYAELWLSADRINGYKAASKSEPDPFLIFNSGPTVESIERSIESWTVVGGSAVPVEKVAAIKEADLNRWFPKPIAERLGVLVKKAVAHVKGSELAAGISELEAGIQATLLKHLAS